MRLGIDIGGVISDTRAISPWTLTKEHEYLNMPFVEGVIDAVQLLADHHGPNNIHIVSKCGPNTERRTRAWLEHHDWYNLTGMWRHNVWFCRDRAEKAPICKELDIDTFIDDHIEVLSHMNLSRVKCLLFRPDPDPNEDRFPDTALNVIRVQTWGEVLERLKD